MIDKDVLKNAESVFSIPSKSEGNKIKALPPAVDTCRKFLVATIESERDLEVSLLTDVEEIIALKKILVIAYQSSKTKEMRTVNGLIRDAGLAINGLIRSLKWRKSKKNRNKITASIIKKLHTQFVSKLKEALQFIDDESAKTNMTFYKTLIEAQQKALNPLPLHLDVKKLWIPVSADVLIYSRQAPLVRHKRVEEGCYLMTADLIAVNTDRYKGTAKQTDLLVKQVREKLGATLHFDPVPRISDNVRFFLVLNFGCNITNCHFVDTLQTTLPEITVETGEDIAYATRRLQEVTVRQAIERQRNLRLQFERDHETVVSALKQAEGQEEGFREEFEEVATEFRNFLAYPTDPYDGKGLPYADSHRIDSYIVKWMRKELDGESNFDTRLNIQRDFFKIKVEALSQIAVIEEIRRDLVKARERVKALTEMKANALEMFAANNGIISPKIERLFMSGYEV